MTEWTFISVPRTVGPMLSYARCFGITAVHRWGYHQRETYRRGAHRQISLSVIFGRQVSYCHFSHVLVDPTLLTGLLWCLPIRFLNQHTIGQMDMTAREVDSGPGERQRISILPRRTLHRYSSHYCVTSSKSP